jgi:hypothetical protein
MVLYQLAFVAAAVLFIALVFMQVIMQRQVHHANSGNQEISPWDVRFANNMFGRYGIWNLHRRAYERSKLRSLFLVLAVAWIVSVSVALLDFFSLR